MMNRCIVGLSLVALVSCSPQSSTIKRRAQAQALPVHAFHYDLELTLNTGPDDDWDLNASGKFPHADSSSTKVDFMTEEDKGAFIGSARWRPQKKDQNGKYLPVTFGAKVRVPFESVDLSGEVSFKLNVVDVNSGGIVVWDATEYLCRSTVVKFNIATLSFENNVASLPEVRCISKKKVTARANFKVYRSAKSEQDRIDDRPVIEAATAARLAKSHWDIAEDVVRQEREAHQKAKNDGTLTQEEVDKVGERVTKARDAAKAIKKLYEDRAEDLRVIRAKREELRQATAEPKI